MDTKWPLRDNLTIYNRTTMNNYSVSLNLAVNLTCSGAVLAILIASGLILFIRLVMFQRWQPFLKTVSTTSLTPLRTELVISRTDARLRTQEWNHLLNLARIIRIIQIFTVLCGGRKHDRARGNVSW